MISTVKQNKFKGNKMKNRHHNKKFKEIKSNEKPKNNKSNEKPKVSIIISAYNEEKFIRQSLESALNQSLKDIEIIIVNDGSEDNTLEIIREYIEENSDKKDSRVKLINNIENISLGASRNKAMKIAKGDYIGFLDGDDWLDEKTMEISYNQAKEKNTDITIFQAINYDDETGKIYENDWFNLNMLDESFDDTIFTPEDTKDILFTLSVSACQKIYKKSFLDKINAKFPEKIYFEDMPFFFYVYLKAKRVSIIRKHLYYRRKHEDSITHIVDDNYFDTIISGNILFDIFIRNGFYENYKKDLIHYKVNRGRMALLDIKDEFKEELFNLLKIDYEKFYKSEYKEDYDELLRPINRKFFFNVLKSENI